MTKFQTYNATTNPADGAPRLAALREVLKAESLDGFLVPRADAHLGENVPAKDERLAWLTGFTGSAGFCAAMLNTAGVFIDGRYRIQVKDQIDLAVFTPVHWPETELSDWLITELPAGGRVAFDPWLHGKDQIDGLRKALTPAQIELVPSDNLVDRIWADQPAPPTGPIRPHGIEFAGETSKSKRDRIAQTLRDDGLNATVLSMPDSINWLLNIRGDDTPQTPVALGFCILFADATVTFFVEPAKISKAVREHLGADITIKPPADFGPDLAALQGQIGVDGSERAGAPLWVSEQITTEITYTQDPCILPKAIKNDTEIEGARAAHLRDGAVMAEFLAWIAAQEIGPDFTEINVAKKLEGFRSATNMLMDISFETISATGPNGAITHYRVTDETNRTIQQNEILLVDSGGQYPDGTTDITRTVVIGTPTDEQRACFTRVLQGMIAISIARWPTGRNGSHLDALARVPLWQAGLDFDHGVGHGVGSFLGVHEGPQGIAWRNTAPLHAGMIVSNEPGYYREGAFGIRIENLLAIKDAAVIAGGDARKMLDFETLTYTPIDRNLIAPDLLSVAERDWLNAYHAETLKRIAPLCSAQTQTWLKGACAEL